jgi:amicoumacin kinase
MLSPALLNTAASSFGLRAEDLDFVSHSQNHVFRVRSGAGPAAILRISTGRYRTRAEITTELRWILHLVAQGIPACAPIPATTGDLCVEIEHQGGRCVVACFEGAPGRSVTPRYPDLAAHTVHYEALGGLLARMHLHTIPLTSGVSPAWPRKLWYESRFLREDLDSLGDRLSPRFRQSVANLVGELRRLPVTPAEYGLIHGDVSFSNCHFDGVAPWIFDFDNCEYGSFLQDIATVLYDSIYCKAMNRFADAGLADRMAPVFQAFLSGYRRERTLPELPRERLRQFFLLREAVIYGHYHRMLDLKNLPATFLEGLEVMRNNLESQSHQVDFAGLPL